MDISPQGTQEHTMTIDLPIPYVVRTNINITSGVAFVDFSTVYQDPNDWARVWMSFLVGPQILGKYLDSVSMVVPATIDIVSNLDTSRTVGWGVDESFSDLDQAAQQVRVHAKLVVKTKYSEILRVAYHVSTTLERYY